MVAPRRMKKVFCTIVRVPTTDNKTMNRMSLRPSDLLPWADPYISRLVTKLQSEVRRERQQRPSSQIANPSTLAELDPPSPSAEPHTDWDWESTDEPRWTYRDLPTTDFTE